MIGSEGILGVITEASSAVARAPALQELAGVSSSLTPAIGAVRELSQSGLYPSNCRLLDPAGRPHGAAEQGKDVYVLRAGLRVGTSPCRRRDGSRMQICRAHHGARRPAPSAQRVPITATDRVVLARRFLREPTFRDTIHRQRHHRQTFEPPSAWDRFEQFRRSGASTDRGRGQRSAAPARSAGASPTSTLTAPAPYYTILAPAQRGSEVEQWTRSSAAASRCPSGGRRHDHPPPLGRPRPPALVRRPAARSLRRRPGGRQARAGPGLDPQPGRADRP